MTKDGDEVGTLTSPVISPRFGTIALAVLDTAAANDGEKVEVGGAVATVAPLSLFDPEKKRPGLRTGINSDEPEDGGPYPPRHG